MEYKWRLIGINWKLLGNGRKIIFIYVMEYSYEKYNLIIKEEWVIDKYNNLDEF